MHNLTHHECVFAQDRIEGRPATPKEMAAQDTKNITDNALRDSIEREHPKFKTIISSHEYRYVKGIEIHGDHCFIAMPAEYPESILGSYTPTKITKGECFQ